MANELTSNASASLEKGNHKESFVPGSISVTQTGVGGWCPVVSVGTSEEDLAPVDITTLGWLFMRNLDSTNYVTYGAKDTTMKALGRLKAGEIAMFRLEPGITMRWAANTAAVKVKVILLED